MPSRLTSGQCQSRMRVNYRRGTPGAFHGILLRRGNCSKTYQEHDRDKPAETRKPGEPDMILQSRKWRLLLRMITLVITSTLMLAFAAPASYALQDDRPKQITRA